MHYPPTSEKIRPWLQLHCGIPVSSSIWTLQGIPEPFTWLGISCRSFPVPTSLCILSFWAGWWSFCIVLSWSLTHIIEGSCWWLVRLYPIPVERQLVVLHRWGEVGNVSINCTFLFWQLLPLRMFFLSELLSYVSAFNRRDKTFCLRDWLSYS